ncbi:hypothetical protein [Paenibacillus antarcticus]|uniref:Uncharacterized protein n=1 Tax=Paenibacillus antarcticus TaxID=253703 RepID=A0A168NIG2_9BACL|nr:hypothetical protein [Paenibacillus antarcticus]OAB45824.1 hypothetical protein PBAT_13060 [Paenibacillus antarcticus]
MRIVRRLVLLFLLLVIALIVAVIVYIRPDKAIDMSYEPVDMKVKVWNMVKNKVPEIELTGDELNNIAKKKMVEALKTTNLSVDVTGAEFIIHGDEVEAQLNGKWGILPFGVNLFFHMESSGSDLILKHLSTQIKQITIPNSMWSLQPITFSLKEHIPDIVGIDQVDFKTDSIMLTFKIDWTLIPQFLLDFK